MIEDEPGGLLIRLEAEFLRDEPNSDVGFVPNKNQQ